MKKLIVVLFAFVAMNVNVIAQQGAMSKLDRILQDQRAKMIQENRQAFQRFYAANRGASVTESRITVRGMINPHVVSGNYITSSFEFAVPDMDLHLRFDGFTTQYLWVAPGSGDDVFVTELGQWHDSSVGPGRDRPNVGQLAIRRNYVTEGESPVVFADLALVYDKLVSHTKHSFSAFNPFGTATLVDQVSYDWGRTMLSIQGSGSQKTVAYNGQLTVLSLALAIEGVVDSARTTGINADQYFISLFEDHEEKILYLNRITVATNDESNPFTIAIYGSDLRVKTVHQERSLYAYVSSVERGLSWQRPIVRLNKVSPTATEGVSVPSRFGLEQNYPNPYNAATEMEYSVPQPSKVTIRVFDLLGQEVETLVDNEFHQAGSYIINYGASGLSSGTYFYRLEVGGKTVATRKMTILR